MRIDADIARVRSVLGHIEMGAEKVTAQAVNRAILAARAIGTKKVKKLYIIKAVDLKHHATIRKASKNKLSATINEKSSPLPLLLFDVEARKKDGKVGVFAKIKKEKGRKKEVKGAFMAVATKYEGSFQRIGKERMPIEPLYGPSIAQMFGNEETIKTMEERGQEILDKRLEHGIDKMLEGVIK